MKNFKSCLISIFLIVFATKQIDAQTYVWYQLNSFGGGSRAGGSSFTIGTKGYITCGLDNFSNTHNDLWEYDPTTGYWTQKATIPGPTRYGGCGFAISNYGFVCLGWQTLSTNAIQLDDLWQYDPLLNLWTQKTNFPGGGRYHASAFTINNKAYVGLGYKPLTNDFYEYNATNDTWSLLVNSFPGGARMSAVGFSITYYNGTTVTKGYICTGSLDANGTILPSDLWEFTPGATVGSGTWAAKTNFPGAGRITGFAFSINEKAYVSGGRNMTTGFNDLYEYNPVNNSWAAKPIFPGVNVVDPSPFVIGNIAYLGGGANYNASIFYDLFWKYAPATGMDDLTPNADIFLKAFSTDDNTIKFIFSKPLDDDFELTIINILGEKMLTEKIKKGTIEAILQIEKTKFEILLYQLISNNGIKKNGKISFH